MDRVDVCGVGAVVGLVVALVGLVVVVVGVVVVVLLQSLNMLYKHAISCNIMM